MSQQVESQDEQFAIVCDRMANGETLTAICKEAGMPSRATFQRWVRNDDNRRKQYQLARQAQADFYFDQIKDLAFDSSHDTTFTERGTPVCNHEWVARSRVKVDALKWIASKLDPMKFGDRMPDVVAAKELDAEQLQSLAVLPPQKIERLIIEPGEMVQDEKGNWSRSPGAANLLARIAELEAQLAGKSVAPKPPALLEYDPGLPKRMDQDIAQRMVKLIRDHVPVDGTREPAAVLDEVLTVCRSALRMHFARQKIDATGRGETGTRARARKTAARRPGPSASADTASAKRA